MQLINLDFGQKFLLVCLLIGATTAYFLSYANEQLKGTYLAYAEAQTRKISTLIINKAVSKQILETLSAEEMISVDDENPAGFNLSFNTIAINRVLAQTTNLVQLYLKSVEEGKLDRVELSEVGIEVPETSLRRGILYEIPFSTISNNVLLANLGPKIPVKFTLIGDTVSTVKTDIKSYGINNALVTIYISLSVHTQVIIPLASSIAEVTSDIPIAIKLIQGQVPTFYYGTHDLSSFNGTIPLVTTGSENE